jgi:hypothetical protein
MCMAFSLYLCSFCRKNLQESANHARGANTTSITLTLKKIISWDDIIIIKVQFQPCLNVAGPVHHARIYLGRIGCP